MLVVPDKFNRNSPNVTALMTPEQSGIWLLERMRKELGFESYVDKKVLDFGCGVRFSQAIINTQYPFGRYLGVDVFPEMIDFLKQNVNDPRFSYHYLDAYHPLYNPRGAWLTPDREIPIAEQESDIACMFSVITHQNPSDTQSIVAMLRRYVSSDGYLFFTCFLDPEIGEFEDRSPGHVGGRCFYNPEFLKKIVEGCGWRQVGYTPAEAPLIGDSFVYQRTGTAPSGELIKRSLGVRVQRWSRRVRSYWRL